MVVRSYLSNTFKGKELNDDLRRVARGKMRTLRDDVERQVRVDRSDITFPKCEQNRIYPQTFGCIM